MNKERQNVVSILRQMILSGELKAGERIIEIATAERLGVSRTPIRIALRTLEQEGLLTKQPSRGYRVRKTSSDEIDGAIEVRGVLEGLAALQVAEKGMPSKTQDEMQSCLKEGDAIFSKGSVTEKDLEAYQELNKRFHNALIEAAANPAISAALSRNEHLPFASANAIAIDTDHLDREFKRMNFAHMQHHAAFDAMINRQGARAEAIMREHANATLNYAKIFAEMDTSKDTIRIIS
jgi:GntR family transcriptional regulator of vanillate catabolism